MKIALLFYSKFYDFIAAMWAEKNSQKNTKNKKQHNMNHTKCTIYTFRNRLWPFDRTRSGKKRLVFTRLLLFFGGLIAQINLANSTFTTVRLCTLHLRTFPQTMQLPPEESNSTSQFALQQATVKTAKSSKPDGPAAGKTRAEVTRPARRYF